MFAVARAAAGASLDGAADVAHVDRGDEDLAGELEVELLTAEVRVSAGERAELRVVVRNRAADEIRGEAQLISPHETWPIATPWTQGFAVGAGAERSLTFAVHPPSDFAPGTFWGLVKVMYFGRLWYTPFRAHRGGGSDLSRPSSSCRDRPATSSTIQRPRRTPRGGLSRIVARPRSTRHQTIVSPGHGSPFRRADIASSCRAG